MRKEGIRGLYRGNGATLARELPGNAAWFGVYEYISNSFVPEGGSRDDVKGVQTMVGPYHVQRSARPRDSSPGHHLCGLLGRRRVRVLECATGQPFIPLMW